MKLPDNKKERMQLIVLGVIGGAAVVYAVVMLGIVPLIKGRSERARKIEELRTKIRDAETVIQQNTGGPDRNYEALTKIVEFSEKNLLRPRLGGNYFLPTTEIVERWARQSEIKIPPPSEAGRADVPQTDPNRAVVRSYNFGITLNCGLHETIKFLRMIEDEDPCITVTRLSIVGNSAQPEKHAVNIGLQRPIWADDGMFAKVRTDMEQSAQNRRSRK